MPGLLDNRPDHPLLGLAPVTNPGNNLLSRVTALLKAHAAHQIQIDGLRDKQL
tara:strand:+ start:696 stop:854 length:159 start_codon:yes stop_codon:yes gene_type:complete